MISNNLAENCSALWTLSIRSRGSKRQIKTIRLNPISHHHCCLIIVGGGDDLQRKQEMKNVCGVVCCGLMMNVVSQMEVQVQVWLSAAPCSACISSAAAVRRIFPHFPTKFSSALRFAALPNGPAGLQRSALRSAVCDTAQWTAAAKFQHLSSVSPVQLADLLCPSSTCYCRHLWPVRY